jgi:4-amino-4-deoxy-L-arabinose transferase-like glycosyltransferase
VRLGALLPQGLIDSNLSGSPIIYPPLGALANSIGGLAGARILSLVFLLGATVLLYCTASRLFGRITAIAASALWSVTEPVLRLTFATYDPISVSLTALSVWLAVEACYRERRYALVLASAATLALADATAYSGIVFFPVVVVLAFIVWVPRVSTRQAVYCAALAVGSWLAFFGLLIALSHSWSGLMETVLNRAIHDHTRTTVIVGEILKSSLLVMLLAVVGAVVALAVEGFRRALPVIALACAAFVVPAAQIHYHSVTSIDKHVAYGLWLAALAAGYGVAKLITMPPPRLRPAIALCCVIAFLYPMTDGWQKAWGVFHAWPNATSFVAALKPVAGQSKGPILVPAATWPSVSH